MVVWRLCSNGLGAVLLVAVAMVGMLGGVE